MLCGCARDDTIHDKENQQAHRNAVSTIVASSSASVPVIKKQDSRQSPLQQQDNKVLIHYQLGCSLQEKGKIWEAVELFRKVIALNPAHWDATFALASTLQELKLAEAEYYYMQALSIKPAHHACYYSLGYLYQDRGDLDKAIVSFQVAAKLAPDDVDTWINLGLAHKSNHNLPDAIHAYQRAISINERSTMAWFNQGNAFAEVKKYDQAIRSFTNVLRVEPNHVDALFNLAVAFQDRASSNKNDDGWVQKKADYNSAIRCYEEVRRRRPDMVDAVGAAASVKAILADAAAAAADDYSDTSSISFFWRATCTSR